MTSNSATEEEQAEDPISIGSILPRIRIGAFFLSEQTERIIRNAFEDRRMHKTITNIAYGGIPGATQYYSDNPTPHVLIVESTNNPDQMFDDLSRLATVCDPKTHVMIAGPINDVNLYRELTKQGISEYLLTPTAPTTLIRIIGDLFQSAEDAPQGRLISCIGAVGGCGASSIAQNLSWMLSKAPENQTLYADIDLTFGSGALRMGSNAKLSSERNIATALSTPERFDSNSMKKIWLELSNNLYAMVAPNRISGDEFTQETYQYVIETMRQNVDNLVLDLPNGFDAIQKKLITISDEIIIVTTSDLYSLRNTRILFNHLTQTRTNDAPPRVVINKFGDPEINEIAVENIQRFIEPTITLPYCPEYFKKAEDEEVLALELAHDTPFYHGLSELRSKLLGEHAMINNGKTAQSSPLQYVAKLLNLLSSK